MRIQIINEICECLSHDILHANRPRNSGLFSGTAGVYLLIFLWRKEFNINIANIDSYFYNFIERVTECNRYNYTDGITGIGWLLEFLCQQSILERKNIEDLMIQIDNLSFHYAMDCMKKGNNDFLYGPIGEAIYLLSRINKNKDTFRYLEQIVIKLDKMAIKGKAGLYWEESTFMLQGQDKYSSVINFGLSHGLASKIIFLSLMIENNIQVTLCKSMLTESIRFLRNCKNKFTHISLYPSVLMDSKGDNSPIRWSYGDLGIGWAYWKAGISLKDNSLKYEAIEIYRNIAGRLQKGESGINETSICRGSAGVANMYRNMYRETKRKEFKKVSDEMIEMTLRMMNHEEGIAGIKMLNNTSSNTNEHYWEKNPNLLMGAAGVGLVLFSSISTKEYYWDKCLLLS